MEFNNLCIKRLQSNHTPAQLPEVQDLHFSSIVNTPNTLVSGTMSDKSQMKTLKQVETEDFLKEIEECHKKLQETHQTDQD